MPFLLSFGKLAFETSVHKAGKKKLTCSSCSKHTIALFLELILKKNQSHYYLVDCFPLQVPSGRFCHAEQEVQSPFERGLTQDCSNQKSYQKSQKFLILEYYNDLFTHNGFIITHTAEYPYQNLMLPFFLLGNQKYIYIFRKAQVPSMRQNPVQHLMVGNYNTCHRIFFKRQKKITLIWSSLPCF